MAVPSAPPKPTSFDYGHAYQLGQAESHRHRHTNNWKQRIALAHEMIDKYVLPRLDQRAPRDIRTLDVGCSIGTMAIEMALRGFTACGVDFDESALEIARQLAAEENADVQFVRGDVAAWKPEGEASIDIAICFDIFEHLHDDELGALLHAIRQHLSEGGALVFHTFPLQFDYLFFSRSVINWPLRPLRWLSRGGFERAVRAYASLIDVALLVTRGYSYEERNKKRAHCNPLTRDRLVDVLERAGFRIDFIASTNLYPYKQHVLRRFGKHPIAHRNLYGVASPAPRMR